ncbi:MAG: Stp1/IreP family PP2C-type Ser/Thr phosphatase [Myxococcales bacterium]|nr:Stp1/IreP family PP2C-type Ser/Thr phosphatase [Myxococcales bacterium]
MSDSGVGGGGIGNGMGGGGHTPPTAPFGTMEAPTVPQTPPSAGAGDPGTAGSPALGAGQVRLRLFGRTDVGRIREHNEDNFLVADLTQQVRGLTENIRNHVVGNHGTLMAVCDGMGGAAAGEVASKLAVDIIYEQMQAGGPPRHRDELARRLVRAVEVAGMRIFAEAKLDRNRRGMGTTATAAALVDDHVFLAQVGDSRGYVLRGDQLNLVTRDQSLVNQLIEAGQLTEEEAENFEHSNIILQALGTADSVQVDLTYFKAREGDTLLLCSDGLSGMVRTEELRQVLLAHPEPIEVCRVLTDKANEAGGHDNITVIVAKFEAAKLEPTDPPAKYTKYVFQTEDNTSYPAAQMPEVSAPVQPDPQQTQRAIPSGKLSSTQVGMNANDLMREMAKVEERRASQAAPSPGSAPAAAAPAAAGAKPERVSTRAELESAGVPTGLPMWIWIVTVIALGLVGAGIYALVGSKGGP